MTAFRYAVRALALSLSLTAAGAFLVAGSAIPAQASATDPIGGAQLAARGVIVNLAPGVPPPPAMPGASFLLADMDTGQILVARTPHATHLPASTLKTLTALTLIPVMSVNHRITVKPEDVRVDGTHLGILPGTTYRVGTLMQGLLMASGNDAAYALARGNGGVAVTLKAMNATATGLNAFDTVAKDPSGLDKPGQTTSAYDLALIGRAAMKLPDFRRYVGTKRATLPGGRTLAGKRTPGFTIGNHNLLLYNYPGAIGIKNGYTVAAKFTYVEAATRGGKTYLVTEMASPRGSWRPVAAMLDWAFAYGASLTPIGELVKPGPSIAVVAAKPPVAAADRPDSLPPTSTGDAVGGAQLAPPWVAFAGLVSALALVGAWARRTLVARRTIARRGAAKRAAGARRTPQRHAPTNDATQSSPSQKSAPRRS